MRRSSVIWSSISSVCFGISFLWAAAFLLKDVFGVRVTVPILPPIDLAQVDQTTALIFTVVFAALGFLAAIGARPESRPAPSMKGGESVADESVRLGEGPAEYLHTRRADGVKKAR